MYEKFQRLLDERKLTAFDVSKATGIAASSLSDWKNGKSTPKIDKIKTLADYFGVSVDYFVR